MATPNDTQANKCLFCRIAHKQEPKSQLLYDKDDIVIFKDIRPASDHHYLVIPKSHVRDPKHLNLNDVELVERLVATGNEFLSQMGGSVDEARLGFHWPPFNSISHLHLHVISPVKNMGFISGLVFKPNSYWFVSPDWVLERLRNMNKT